jgi:hypothetical protein
VLKQKEHPLAMFDTMFQNIHGFMFAWVGDLNMSYLLIPLMGEMSKILSIVVMFESSPDGCHTSHQHLSIKNGRSFQQMISTN